MHPWRVWGWVGVGVWRQLGSSGQLTRGQHVHECAHVESVNSNVLAALGGGRSWLVKVS